MGLGSPAGVRMDLLPQTAHLWMNERNNYVCQSPGRMKMSVSPKNHMVHHHDPTLVLGDLMGWEVVSVSLTGHLLYWTASHSTAQGVAAVCAVKAHAEGCWRPCRLDIVIHGLMQDFGWVC